MNGIWLLKCSTTTPPRLMVIYGSGDFLGDQAETTEIAPPPLNIFPTFPLTQILDAAQTLKHRQGCAQHFQSGQSSISILNLSKLG